MRSAAEVMCGVKGGIDAKRMWGHRAIDFRLAGFAPIEKRGGGKTVSYL
jgi:hypothetical protein